MKDPFEVKLDDVSTIITAAVILHNICESNHDDFVQEWFILPTAAASSVNNNITTENDLPYRIALSNFFTTGSTIHY